MQKIQNHKGLWFLPGGEEKAVLGILGFSPAGGIEMHCMCWYTGPQ
jgi:hypothetical protein